MSQNIFSDINPSATSGNQLATLLNAFKDAVASGFTGTARPANLQAGGYWVDTTLAGSPDFKWVYKVYTGSIDISVFTMNINTGLVTIAGTTGDFDITQISADAVGPMLNLIKQRIANSGQTLVSDVLGEVNFYSTDNTGATIISAKVKAVSENNTTSGQAGAYLAIEAIDTNSGALLEKMRILNGNVGIGNTAPSTKLHVTGTGITTENVSDSTTGSIIVKKKKRISGGGQVLSGDFLSVDKVSSTDSAGVDLDSVFSVEVEATENHTTTAQGSKATVKVKKIGTNTATSMMEIGEEVNFPDGSKSKFARVGSSGTAATNVKLHRSGTTKMQVVAGDDATAEGSGATVLAEVGKRVENYTNAGKPAAGNIGRVIYITDLAKLQYDTGSVWLDLSSPNTTKGDITVHNGTINVRLPVGTNGQIPYADSAEAAGIKWVNRARYARYYLSGTQSITDNTNTEIAWDTEQYNTIQASMMNLSTGRLTLGRAGVVHCSAAFGITNSVSIVSGNRTALYLRKNGGSLLKIAGDTFEGSVTETKQSQGSDLLFFDNGTDYYDFVVYLDFGGGPYNLGSVNTGVTFIALHEL